MFFINDIDISSAIMLAFKVFFHWIIVWASYAAAKEIYFEKRRHRGTTKQRWLVLIVLGFFIWFIAGVLSYLMGQENYTGTVGWFITIMVPFSFGWLRSISIDEDLPYYSSERETVLVTDGKQYKMSYKKSNRRGQIFYTGKIFSDGIKYEGKDPVFRNVISATAYFECTISKVGYEKVLVGFSPEKLFENSTNLTYTSVRQDILKAIELKEANFPEQLK